MVGANLAGGLGNYMFQIAAAQALAWDLGVEAVFDFNLASQVHRNIRSYQDNIFRYVKEVVNPRFTTRYSEPNFGYNELPRVDGQYLIGYFQSDKYFKHHKEAIGNMFMREVAEEVLRNPHILDFPNSCAIHVRRGDYIKLASHHPPLTMNYYNAGMALANSTQYLIFSDDMEWCKANFVGEQYTFIEGNSDYIDMYLMSLCKEAIIANSSFSWWGAWLGFDQEQVIAPKKWFGPAKGNIITKDMIPEEWLLID